MLNRLPIILMVEAVFTTSKYDWTFGYQSDLFQIDVKPLRSFEE